MPLEAAGGAVAPQRVLLSSVTARVEQTLTFYSKGTKGHLGLSGWADARSGSGIGKGHRSANRFEHQPTLQDQGAP